jgi:AraC family transcriptional activator of pobA
MSVLKTIDKSIPNKSIKIARFDPKKSSTKPHRHKSYLEVVALFKAFGKHVIDEESYSIDGPIVFTIRKEQIHYWEMNPDVDGIVLIIKNEFIQHCFDPAIQNLLHQLTLHQGLKPVRVDELKAISDLLLHAFHEEGINQHYKEGMLKAFLAELSNNSLNIRPSKQSVNPIFNEFLNLILSGEVKSIKVADFAALLNTTPQNLTIICRKENGQTAAEIIAQFTINEAIRLLFYSTKNISDIAYSLGFKDNSHFIKFFKRYKNDTPRNYRKKY